MFRLFSAQTLNSEAPDIFCCSARPKGPEKNKQNGPDIEKIRQEAIQEERFRMQKKTSWQHQRKLELKIQSKRAFFHFIRE